MHTLVTLLKTLEITECVFLQVLKWRTMFHFYIPMEKISVVFSPTFTPIIPTFDRLTVTPTYYGDADTTLLIVIASEKT